MHKHTTSNIIMCRPTSFAFNEQTGVDNEFQHRPKDSLQDIQHSALLEFDNMTNQLSKNGIDILELNHHEKTHLPDAVFLNNWFTTTIQNDIRIFSMKTVNRQNEIIPEQLKALLEANNFKVNAITKIADELKSKAILEGTGAIVFDHKPRKAYAALSDRCEKELFLKYCEKFQWHPIYFKANSSKKIPFYHTNVMMSIGQHFVAICGESLSPNDRDIVFSNLEEDGKTIIDLTLQQTELSFCGNIIELSDQSSPVIVMSQTARNAFTRQQMQQLESLGECVPCNVKTIEHIGGGSVRCMIAENFMHKSA